MILISIKDRILQIYSILIYIFLFGPIGVVILFTFNDYSYAVFPLRGFTLKWFETITTGPLAYQIRLCFRTSVIVAACTGIIVAILGTITAFGLVRFRFRFRSWLNILILFPLIMPYILYAVSLLTFYSLIEVPYSLWTIVLGHVVITLPFSIIIISASLWGFDRRLEEASSDLGANVITTFRKITFPLIKNGVLAGAIIGFILSFNEFIVSVFTTGRGATTLPVYMWGMWWTASLPELNVISTTIVAIVAVIYIIFVVLFPKAIKLQL